MINLDLSEEEAKVIAHVLWNVEGSQDGARGHTDNVLRKLNEHKHKWSHASVDCRIKNGWQRISFN